MPDKPVALVTGANQGIGLQIAKDLVPHGYTVLIGSRSFEKGEEAARGIGLDAHALQLDVTDQASIAAAAERIRTEFGRLDVLVNNAGIWHTGKPNISFEEAAQSGELTDTPLAEIRAVFNTNVFGVIAVTQAMLPLLRKAPAGRIVNMGSTAGSLTRGSDRTIPRRVPFGMYSVSKTALNSVTLAFALALESTNIKVNAACPGYTSTAFNHFTGNRTVEEGAREAVRLALIGPDGPTGTFSDENGSIPW